MPDFPYRRLLKDTPENNDRDALALARAIVFLHHAFQVHVGYAHCSLSRTRLHFSMHAHIHTDIQTYIHTYRQTDRHAYLTHILTDTHRTCQYALVDLYRVDTKWSWQGPAV
jgi:hypothetical protein